MPTLSIYVTDEVYIYLSKQGKPSMIGKQWIEQKYIEKLKENNKCLKQL